jgi:signal transduction histidine kinase
MPSNMLRSTPLRLILYLGSAFLVALAIASAVAYFLVHEELSARTDRDLTDTFNVIAQSFEEDDLQDVVDLLRAHIRASVGNTEVFQLLSPTGAPLASNMGQVPPGDGWSTLTAAQVDSPNADADFRVLSGMLRGYRLSVGTSLKGANDVAGIVVTALGWTIGGLLVVTLLGGIAAAISGQRRLDTIAHTMEQISHGNLAARIPRSRRNDDIDMLVASVNAALDRLAALVEGMRQVSVDIAHELKTPLNRLSIAVSGAIEAAEAGRETLPLLEDTQAEIHQVISIFDAMLRIAQIEAGARRSRFTAVDLVPVLDSIADAYGPVAADKQQSLTLAMAENLPTVTGDKDLLTQAIANLVENAIRHCPAGASIAIDARSNGGVRLVVSDNGLGFSTGSTASRRAAPRRATAWASASSKPSSNFTERP